MKCPNRISVVRRHRIESAVVTADPPTATRFCCHQQGTAPVALASIGDAQVNELLQLGFGDGQLLGVETACSRLNRWGIRWYVMSDAMFRLFDRKRGRLNLWESVQQLEERILCMRDEVDGAVGNSPGVSGGESTKVLQIDEQRVAVVGGEVIRRQKICAEDSVFDVCNCEFKGKVDLCDRKMI